MVSGTSPKFTLFSKTGSGLNIFLKRDAIRRIACLSSAAVTAVPLMSAITVGLGQKGVHSLLDFLSQRMRQCPPLASHCDLHYCFYDLQRSFGSVLCGYCSFVRQHGPRCHHGHRSL